VAGGLQKTLSLLTDTANEAAVPVLLSGLNSSDRSIQEGSLAAILQRRRGAGPRALVERWGRLSERWKQQIANHPRLIAPAVRDAILSDEGELCANGCSALLRIREFELIPALVTATEEPDNRYAAMAAETLLSMCELLHEEISGPREKRQLQEPTRVRRQVLPSLERAVDHFEKHRRREAVEAFLILAHPDNALLKRILCEPRHPAYLVVAELLRHSSRKAIMRLVLNLLESRFAPSLAVQVVSHRDDLPFVRQLLRRLADPASSALRPSLRRVDRFAWIQDDLSFLDGLSDSEQEAAVELITVSNMDRIRAFDAVAHVLRQGGVAARRAAAAALAEFGGAEANRLVLDGLHDPDPIVQANLVVQLRERGIPGAISRLIQLLDSPHEEVAKAAQSCLSEFNFTRYVSVFDMMEEPIRRSTGLLVKRVDPQAIDHLAGELRSRSRTRRLRALELAMAMDAAPQVESLILHLLKDDDHFVRAEAARTLAYCHSAIAQRCLRESLMDRSVAVREAAEQSLRKLSESGNVTTGGSFAAALRKADQNPLIEASQDS
jgi:hypothetical protein